MSQFDITCDERSFELLVGGSKALSLTVTNRDNRPVTALISMRVKGGIPPGIRFVHDPQLPFAGGATNVIPLSVQADHAAQPRPFVVTVIVASEHDSDESFASIDFAVQLVQPAQRAHRPWWPWAVLAAAVIMVCIGSFILAWHLRGGPVQRMPEVIGKTLAEARTALAGAGYRLVLLPTTTDDLDSRRFRERTAELITTITTAQAKKDKVDDDKKKPEQQVIAVAAQPSLEDRLVWDIDADGLGKDNTEVGVKVVPELITMPNIMQATALGAAQTLADAGLRFRIAEKLPAGYRYRQETAATIWALEPKGPLVFHGSLIHLSILPQTLTVPDFINDSLAELNRSPEINAVYVYQLSSKEQKQTNDIGVLQSWATLLANQSSVPYVYKQLPAAGATVDRDQHTVTVYLDAKRVSR